MGVRVPSGTVAVVPVLHVSALGSITVHVAPLFGLKASPREAKQKLQLPGSSPVSFDGANFVVKCVLQSVQARTC